MNSYLDTLDYKTLFEKIVGRSEVELLTDAAIKNFFGDSRILIVGAGGTIGSALGRRLIDANLQNVFFLDHDESSLHGLALSLSNKAASHSNRCFVGDIRDIISLEYAFQMINPEIVVHAAALKHLVILERFPREGFLTNIVGSINLAEVSRRFNVSQFINISTDKAAQPTSVLGYTKKVAEIATEEVFYNTSIKQCSVRFGNVFASRGSVIETFIHQIKNDLPVTLTDVEVARFFMSRNEAANLVLASASLDSSGTYIQNMGQEVLIIDVVNRLAEVIGKAPKLEIIGLQKGEKMHEELFDGPASSTKFPSISRSIHTLKPGIIGEVKRYEPELNNESLEIMKELVRVYT
jgi:FlaA1/EpsC-like NDP-sugar epimerase